MKTQTKKWLGPLLIIVIAIFSLAIANPKPTGIGWFDATVGQLEINMGLDLQGGVHLVYEADMSNIEKGKEAEALSGIQDVIERRVNAFGVAEPSIQPSKIGDNYRLIVELAGIKDVEEAKDLIKETPFLEFRKEGEGLEELTEDQQVFIDEQVVQIEAEFNDSKQKAQDVLQRAFSGEDFAALAREFSDDSSAENGGEIGFFKKDLLFEEYANALFEDGFENGKVYSSIVQSQAGFHIIKKLDQKGEGEEREVNSSHILFQVSDPEEYRSLITEQMIQPKFETTGLTGKELKRSQVDFDQQTGQPVVLLQFNDEGKELFKQITEENIGKQVAIYLDGEIISAPVVNDVIRDGNAVISGSFTLKEAQETSRRLNAGALPVPITLVSQQSVEATLGKASLEKSLKAGAWGLLAVAIFMILYYRLAGLVAVIALILYTSMMVSLFKLSALSPYGVTLTLSGIAGFILSVGMAVDANILIFERMKEEVRRGRDLKAALDEGFKRAWTSIRDGNFSTILTSMVLIAFGSGFIQGFALTLVLGVLLSMFTAIVITRVLFRSLLGSWAEKHKAFILISDKNKNKE